MVDYIISILKIGFQFGLDAQFSVSACDYAFFYIIYINYSFSSLYLGNEVRTAH